MNRVAIVGSREYPDLGAVVRYMESMPDDSEIITGDARGVDATAVATARKLCMPYTVFPANWSRHGKKAGPLRNAIIVERCDMVVAFWDGESKGTLSTMLLARQMKKTVILIKQRRD